MQVQLYYDEFTCTTPLNPNSKEYKIGACYYLLGNISQQFKSRMDMTQLVLLVKYKYVQLYVIDTIFSNIISDIKHVETNGIILF